MNEEQTHFQRLLSTHGLLIAEQILDRFDIHLKPDELSSVLQDQKTIHYQLLRIPLKNILNGIILEQAKDYRIYAQQLFVDYLTSGAANQDGGTQGSVARDDLEQERVDLMSKLATFEQHEFAYYRLVAESQADLIRWVNTFHREGEQAHALDELLQYIEPYLEKARSFSFVFRDFRQQFYHIIIRIKELLQLLPNYRPDVVKQLEYRALLNFNSKIGDSQRT